jgi:hypothetical protein
MKASGQQVSNLYNVRAQQRQLLISSYSFATDIGLSVYMRVFEGLHTEHGYVRIMYRTLITSLTQGTAVAAAATKAHCEVLISISR